MIIRDELEMHLILYVQVSTFCQMVFDQPLLTYFQQFCPLSRSKTSKTICSDDNNDDGSS